MNAVVTLKREGEIAVVTVDSPPVNALSLDVRQGIIDCIGKADTDQGVTAIVLACAGRTFIAGADISEFGKPIAEPWLGRVISSIESASKPVVAAIHGTALGGGFEVALGCHYRVAVKSAKVGFPEVLLGILPGAGGTQRFPRVANVQDALALMISGKPISAGKAASQGAIDKVVDSDLLNEAIKYARALVSDGAPLRKIAAENIPAASVPEGFFDEYRNSIARKTRGYFAPDRIIDAVKAAVELNFDDGLRREGELFLECMNSSESAALRHLFFAERAAAKIPDVPKDTSIREVRKVAVIGAGTMGGGIAMNFASRGIPVRMVDVDEAAIDRGLGVVRSNYARGLSKGRITEAQLEQLMTLFTPTTDYAELDDVDLVIEAVFENMALKKEIFTRLDAVCNSSAILASNTSTLNVDEIAAATKRPDDVIGMHFFSPANIMRLLEVVRGEKTSKYVLATVMKLSKKIGKVGVVSGVCYGFIGNRMLEGYGREAGLMLLEGASAEQIDRAIFNVGFPMGPLSMMDLAGIDVGAKVREEQRANGQLPDDERYGLIADKLYAMGRFGQKTGAGIYDYDPQTRKATASPEISELIRAEAKRLGIEQRAITDQEIVTRCIYPMINEGTRILEEGIALRPGDIDIVWINGYGFPPYRGGPMFYADTIGLGEIHAQIQEYGARLGNEFGYWEPSALLTKLANEGGKLSDL